MGQIVKILSFPGFLRACTLHLEQFSECSSLRSHWRPEMNLNLKSGCRVSSKVMGYKIARSDKKTLLRFLISSNEIFNQSQEIDIG